MLTSEQDLPALLAGLYGGVNDFGPLLQNRRTKQFCYQFGPRVSRLKHAGAASPFGHSLAQCAQKVSAEVALRESLALCGSGRIAEDGWSRSRMGAQVLVVDDEADQRSDLAEMVAALGFRVTTVADGAEALKKLITLSASAILTDLMMPRMDGFAPLKELAARGNRTPTIVLTAFGTIDQAISIVHYLKAFWFLEKPVQPGVMHTLLERAIQQSHLVEETERLSRQLSYQGVLGDLVGDSAPMKEIFSLIRQVAPTTASVLITGESGTGKELVARATHGLSPRSGGPFVAVNCAALPESLIESELFGHEKGAFTGAVERRAGCFEPTDC